MYTWRAVMALQKFEVDGKDVVGDVNDVLDHIQEFTNGVRSGAWVVCSAHPC